LEKGEGLFDFKIVEINAFKTCSSFSGSQKKENGEETKIKWF